MVFGLIAVCELVRSSVELRTGPTTNIADDPRPELISIELYRSQLEKRKIEV